MSGPGGPHPTPDGPGVYAPPRGELPIDARKVRRTAIFAVLRLVSLASSTVVFAISATLIYRLQEPAELALAWLSGFLIWLPTTLLQFRIRFFPLPPDPWLDDGEGAYAERDLRRLGRSELAEMVLGAIPPLALLVWFAREMALSGSLRLLLLLVPLLFIVRGLAAARRQLLREVSLALAAGRAGEARRRLEPFARWGSRWLGDQGLYLLSRARFLDGDREGALAAIGAIRDHEGYAVDVIVAQMDIDRLGPQNVLAVADRLEAEPRTRPLAQPLRALAHLYLGRDDLVVGAAAPLLALPWTDARRFAALLVAAALAPTEPARARALLDQIRWPEERVRALAACWPPIGARLAKVLAQRR